MFGRKKEKAPDDPPVCLIADADSLELGMVTGLFKKHNIPFLTKEHEPVGGLFRIGLGDSPFGMEIWINRSDQTRAMELLDGIRFRAPEEPAGHQEQE